MCLVLSVYKKRREAQCATNDNNTHAAQLKAGALLNDCRLALLLLHINALNNSRAFPGGPLMTTFKKVQQVGRFKLYHTMKPPGCKRGRDLGHLYLYLPNQPKATHPAGSIQLCTSTIWRNTAPHNALSAHTSSYTHFVQLLSNHLYINPPSWITQARQARAIKHTHTHTRIHTYTHQTQVLAMHVLSECPDKCLRHLQHTCQPCACKGPRPLQHPPALSLKLDDIVSHRY